MGGQNEKYVKTQEDIVESMVKKGADLQRIIRETNTSEDALINLIFLPNNWSLLHLAVWYGNQNLVRDILQNNKCNVNKKDDNEETPLFLSAVIDDVDIFKMLLEHKNIDKTLLNRQNQDINIFVAVHDSKACFLHLNENISPDTPEFEKFNQICKEAGSDNIGKILERINQEKNFDLQSLSSINVYQENIPGGSETERVKRNRGATVNTNFNKEKR